MPALVPKKKDAQKFKGFPITAFCFEEVWIHRDFSVRSRRFFSVQWQKSFLCSVSSFTVLCTFFSWSTQPQNYWNVSFFLPWQEETIFNW
jgi:hypothetical protein